MIERNRRIRIAVGLDGEGYWIARGESDAGDEELAQAVADDLAEVSQTYFVDIELPTPAPAGRDRVAIA